MSYELTKKVINSILEREEPEVLALKGTWGAGKTYAWKNIFEEYQKEKCSLSYYSYVSLFGVSSLKDLKLAVVMGTVQIKDDSKANGGLEPYFAKGAKLFDSVKGAIPIVKDISFSAENLLPSFIQNTIICFDDFERLTSSGSIKPEEVLGFISELKEEKNCKVVLIFNEEQLDGLKDCYDKYREKVIDIEIKFSPTVKEAVDIIFKNNDPYYAQVMQCCSKLNITNIRIIQKINKFIRIMEDSGKGLSLHPEVMIRAVQTLVLVAACYYKSSDNLPDLGFLKKYVQISVDLGFIEKNKDKDDKSVKQLRHWKSMIYSYQGYSIFNDLDFAIMDLVEQGYLDETHYVDEITKLHKYFNRRGLKESLDNVWKIYQCSFKDNEDEFIKESYEVFKQAIDAICINDLNSLVSVYYQLDKKVQADELIDLFTKTKITKDNAADFMNQNLINQNPAVAVKLKEYAHSLLPKISLEDAIRYIAENSGWSNNEADIMFAATEEEYYQLFTSYQGEDLYYLVSTCINFFYSMEKYSSITKNSKIALERIAKENNFNRVRILNMYNLDCK